MRGGGWLGKYLDFQLYHWDLQNDNPGSPGLQSQKSCHDRWLDLLQPWLVSNCLQTVQFSPKSTSNLQHSPRSPLHSLHATLVHQGMGDLDKILIVTSAKTHKNIYVTVII